MFLLFNKSKSENLLVIHLFIKTTNKLEKLINHKFKFLLRVLWQNF